jgi:hypothetical protein
MMSEFVTGLGYLMATIVGAAGVSFGLCAGLQAATYAFGPLTINFKHGPVVVDFKEKQ